MLFKKRIEKSCSYCAYCTKLNDEQALCIKRGVVELNGKCRKFVYDPCKRIPVKPKAVDFQKYDSEDFSL
ncbi:MAG: hypothetical protein J6Q30_05130 [Oscillospiraceae bacterium]|nr:hypothetical protein [Oscillospiraceae bacterium]